MRKVLQGIGAISVVIACLTMLGWTVRAFNGWRQAVAQAGQPSYVFDSAGLFAAETREFLNRRIELLRGKHARTVWVATMVVEQVSDPKWEVLARAAAPEEIRSFNPSSCPGYGDNRLPGIYIFIAKRPAREVRALVYGGEYTRLTGDELNRIRRVLKPAFVQGHYGSALSAALEETDKVFTEAQGRRETSSPKRAP